MDGLADPERGIEGGDNTGEREHERCWKKRGRRKFFFFSTGVRFTRDIRVQRNSTYVCIPGCLLQWGKNTFCSSRLIRPFSIPSSLLAAGRRKTKSRRGRRHKSLNPVQRIPGSFSLFPFHPVFLFRWGGEERLLEDRRSSFPSSSPRRRMSMLEKKFSRCWTTTDRVRNATILVFHRPARNFTRGLSVFLWKKGTAPARFDPVRFRPEFFQLCKRDSLFLTVCLSRLPPVARFIVLDLSRAFRDREQD